MSEMVRWICAWCGMMLVWTALSLGLMRCSAPAPVALSPQDVAEIGAYDYEQGQCVELDAGLDARRACVAEVRAKWHAHWRSRFPDGGF